MSTKIRSATAASRAEVTSACQEIPPAAAERDGAVCGPGKIVCENQPTTGHCEEQYLNNSIVARTITGRGEQGGGTLM